MSKQSWKGSTLLNPEPPVLVSCGGLDKPNLITIGWTGTICTQPSMVSISVRPERYSHHLIKESGQFAINLPTEALVKSVDWCGVRSGRDFDKFAACKLHSARSLFSCLNINYIDGFGIMSFIFTVLQRRAAVISGLVKSRHCLRSVQMTESYILRLFGKCVGKNGIASSQLNTSFTSGLFTPVSIQMGRYYINSIV